MHATTDPSHDLRTPAERIADLLRRLPAAVQVSRRIVRAGESACTFGAPFRDLYIVNSGCLKSVSISAGGDAQVVGLHFRGDWIGLDGIATGRYGCDAIAMDTCEVWSVDYDALLRACTTAPPLMRALHEAMSRELGRDHDAMLTLGTQPVDARVAGFLRYWTDALSERGQRTDQITLRMTRAEIGSYLGITLESVSRALSRMARADVIRFAEKSRREIEIPQVEALDRFIERACTAREGALCH